LVQFFACIINRGGEPGGAVQLVV